MADQTVEDLGKLIQSKYPEYSHIEPITLGRMAREKYPDAYGHFTDSSKPTVDYGTTANPKGEKVDTSYLGALGSVAKDVAGKVIQNFNPVNWVKQIATGGRDPNNPLENPYSDSKSPVIGPLLRGDIVDAGEDAAALLASGEIGRYAPEVASVTKGAAKGGYKGFTETPMGPHSFAKGVAGEALAHAIDPSLKGAGFTAGMFSNKIGGGIKGAIQGGADSFKVPISAPPPTQNVGAAALQQPVVPRTPVTPPEMPPVGEVRPPTVAAPTVAPLGIGEVKPPGELSQELGNIRDKNKLDQPQAKEPGTKLTDKEAEAAQSVDRTAKANKLAMHLVNEVPDFESVKPTDEFLKSVSKEAGLNYKASPVTFEVARAKAKSLRKAASQSKVSSETPKP